MNAAVLHTLGQPPRFEPFPDPAPGEGEVMVQVSAASLKPVDRAMAAGTHYASPRDLPVICGVDGVGRLADGTRVFFGVRRKPYGSMAERATVSRALCFPVPDNLDDATAAALPNPALSSWLPLTWRAQLAAGETVLVLGATGVAGRLAVQIAKLLGAGRVIAAGRNPEALNSLKALGADAVILLDQPQDALAEAFAREAGPAGLHVVVDYLWGRPTEALLAALTRKEFAAVKSGVRVLQVGENAGPSITLPAAAMRSAAVTIMGSGGIPPFEVITKAYGEMMEHAATGKLKIDVESAPLADVEKVWARDIPSGRRIVLAP